MWAAKSLCFLGLFVLPARAQYPYAPPHDEQQRVLAATTEFARQYRERLPDFTCTRVTQHYLADAKTKNWTPQVKVAEELSYYGREEHYRAIAANDVPNKKVSMWTKAQGWIETHGNFGPILGFVFDPEVAAKFEWNGWDYIGGKRMYGFSYHVARREKGTGPASAKCISWIAFTTCKSLTYSYHGLLLIDADSLEIRRVTHVPEDLPPSYPSGNESVDYGRVTVAGAEYLLPTADAFETTTGKKLFRNQSTYGDYRKFVAASTLKTDIAATPSGSPGAAPVTAIAHSARPIEAENCFELRDNLARARGSALARAWAAAAFNGVQHAEPELRAVIRSNANSDELMAARAQLAALFMRAGRWREASEQLREAGGEKQDLPDALAKYPKEVVSARGFSRLQLSETDEGPTMQLSVNGKAAPFVIDTGAAISAIAESQAKALGITVHEDHFSIIDIAGQHVECRLAIADELAAGDFRLRNVPFCALAGGAEQHPSIVGLSVVMAFETLRWTHDGNLEIGFPAAKRDMSHSNLCFEGGSLAIDAAIGGRRLALDLDTGNDETFLYPGFADDFPDAAEGAGQQEAYEVQGLGDSVELQSAELPELKLSVAGSEARLENVISLVEPLPSQCPTCYGNAGRDFLRALVKQGRSVTLDFRAMRLTVER